MGVSFRGGVRLLLSNPKRGGEIFRGGGKKKPLNENKLNFQIKKTNRNCVREEKILLKPGGADWDTSIIENRGNIVSRQMKRRKIYISITLGNHSIGTAWGAFFSPQREEPHQRGDKARPVRLSCKDRRAAGRRGDNLNSR